MNTRLEVLENRLKTIELEQKLLREMSSAIESYKNKPTKKNEAAMQLAIQRVEVAQWKTEFEEGSVFPHVSQRGIDLAMATCDAYLENSNGTNYMAALDVWRLALLMQEISELSERGEKAINKRLSSREIFAWLKEGSEIINEPLASEYFSILANYTNYTRRKPHRLRPPIIYFLVVTFGKLMSPLELDISEEGSITIKRTVIASIINYGKVGGSIVDPQQKDSGDTE